MKKMRLSRWQIDGVLSYAAAYRRPRGDHCVAQTGYFSHPALVRNVDASSEVVPSLHT